MSIAAASVLWRLIGPNGHVSECQIWELPTGEFHIRLVHDREPEAIERFDNSHDAVARAQVIASRFIERGWRTVTL
jgi:hypothetical protein